MKKVILILATWAMILPYAFSQQNDFSSYLFDGYKDATIYFKGGLYSQEKVNYNMIDEKLYFIDRKDNQIKVASPIENIVSIQIGDKTYEIDYSGMKEVLNTTPTIYVQYKAKSKVKDPKVAFGNTSGVSSVTTYSELRDGEHALLKSQDRVLSEIYHIYWVEKNKKLKKFSNFNQFVKIYPKNKDVLKAYIEKEKIDFENVDSIVALVNYAENL